MALTQEDQQHPQERQDREILNRLLQEGANPYNLVELARLLIRYRDFPGARGIQRDLALLLDQWHLTEDKLYETTRQLHVEGQIYRQQQGEEAQDWS